MNKKAFTIIEVIVTLVIIAILSGIGIVAYNYVFSKTDETYYHTLENSLLLSGSEYYNDHRDELPINSYNSVPIKSLIDNNYVEPLKDKNGNLCSDGDVYIYSKDTGGYGYEVCLKCGEYESEGSYCSGDIDNSNMIIKPTEVMCKRKSLRVYTGSDIVLTKVNFTNGYEFVNNKGKNAGDYNVVAKLKEGWKWTDNTTGEVTINCPIYKATAEMSLNPSSGRFSYETNATSEISTLGDGDINCTSSDLSIATCSVNNKILTIEPKSIVEAVKKVIITVSQEEGSNYSSSSATYEATITPGDTELPICSLSINADGLITATASDDKELRGQGFTTEYDGVNTKNATSSGIVTYYVIDASGNTNTCSIDVIREKRQRTCKKYNSGKDEYLCGSNEECQGYSYVCEKHCDLTCMHPSDCGGCAGGTELDCCDYGPPCELTCSGGYKKEILPCEDESFGCNIWYNYTDWSEATECNPSNSNSLEVECRWSRR